MPIYCPECATLATDEVKYCKKCGANLRGVVEALQSQNPDKRFDWNRTWVADMLRTEEERARQSIPGRPEDLAVAELKEVTALQNEIKGGIITAFVGVGLTIFLLVFMSAVAAAQNDPKAAMIVGSIWVAGLIPFFIGIGMLVNAFFVSRHFSAHRQKILRSIFAPGASDLREPARTTGELPALEAPPSVVPSVTEHTTRHLPEPEQVLRGKAQRE